MILLLKWLVTTASILISAYLIPGVFVASFWTALWLAVLLGFINMFVRPFLIFLTLPINILTLGLFIFVINALLILFASSIVKGFEVSGFWSALLFSIVLSIFGYILHGLFGTK